MGHGRTREISVKYTRLILFALLNGTFRVLNRMGLGKEKSITVNVVLYYANQI